MRLALSLLAAAGLAACQAPAPGQQGTSPSPDPASAPYYRFLQEPGVGVESEDSIWAALPYDSMQLRRDPCFGACPAYEVTLYRGGRARYIGHRFAPREGEHQGMVQVQDYGRLSWLLDRFNFMALPDSFNARYTDLPGAALTVHRTPGGLKSVYDYGYVGPVELWTLREVFDNIVTRIEWTRSGP